MRITKIEELSKARCKVYIEQEFAFVLYKGELRLYHIREGEEIAQADYQEITEIVLPKRAKLRAMNLLKNREYTTKQLYDKLKEGGYPENIILQALDYVAAYHYTDDLRYAGNYISGHEETRSRRRIDQDLRNRGIDNTTLEKAWQKWEQEGGIQDEKAIIRKLLDKRHYCPEEADLKEQRKTYSFLMRKGFSADAIHSMLRIQDRMFCE